MTPRVIEGLDKWLPPILFAAGEYKIERPPKLYAEVDPPSFFELWWVLDFVISLCSNEIGKNSG